MSNIVYVLSNEAMPNLVKIGITTDINERMRQLYSTGVPLPFTCEYAGVVENAAEVEKALHRPLDTIVCMIGENFLK